MRLIPTLALGLALWASMVKAEPIKGQDEPAFAAAMTHWLAGEEELAITGFAALAEAGNAAARIHLALIDTTPAYQGDWLANQPRDRRIALLRAPGGLSGQSWMGHAAATEPLAQAWEQLWDSDAPVDVVLTFARMGETRAAYMAARQLYLRQKRGFDKLAADPDFPPGLMALAVWDGAKTQLPPGDPGQRLLEIGPLEPQAVLSWAKSIPEGQDLLTILAALCPGSADPAGDLVAYLVQAGGGVELAWVGPPSASLTDTAAYANSVKAVETARRLLRPKPVAAEAKASSCIMSLLSK